MSTNTDTFIPAEAFPPGEHIAEELGARGWTQADLAEIIGASLQRVNEIINGKRTVSAATADALGKAFGTSPDLWLNMQSTYDLWKAAIKSDDTIERRARLYSKLPIKELTERGWLRKSERVEVLEQQVRDFLGVKDLDDQPDIWTHAARKSTGYDDVTPAQCAWMLRARQMAESIDVERFTASKFGAMLQKLRFLAVYEHTAAEVPDTLAEAGIRFVVVQHLPRTKIDGVTFWLNKTSPCVAMSMRFDRIDYFWHTLAHELGHVNAGDGLTKPGSIDDEDRWSDGKPPAEKKADKFAAEFLIHARKLDTFIERDGPIFRKRAVEQFARKVNIHPGIVVGQLHHRTGNYTTLRKLLVKVRDDVTRAAVTDGWGRGTPETN